MRGAHDLANELHRQLELAENERDAAVLERDQARGEAGATVVSVSPAPVVTHVTDMPTTKEALAMSADLAKGMAEAAASIFQPQPVSHAAPAHVHLGGGPCVYGERCGQ